MGIFRLAFMICCLPLAVAPAMAAATESDLLIAARALGFTENPPKGEVTIGIVYDPGNARSAQDAESVRKLLGDGLKVGNLVLKPILVKAENVDTAKVALFFMTDGMGTNGLKVAAASKAGRIPCVTVDIPQVQNGSCAIGVRSQPKIEILVNRAAAADSGVVFATVFRMMITEF